MNSSKRMTVTGSSRFSPQDIHLGTISTYDSANTMKMLAIADGAAPLKAALTAAQTRSPISPAHLGEDALQSGAA